MTTDLDHFEPADAKAICRDILDAKKIQPPGLMRARWRVRRAKTLLGMSVYVCVAAAHTWYVWGLAVAPTYRLLALAVPMLLYVFAEYRILRSYLRARSEYRRQLQFSLDRFPEHADVSAEDVDHYGSALVDYYAQQGLELATVERAVAQVKRSTMKSAAYFVLCAALLGLNLVGCMSGITTNSGSLQLLGGSGVIIAVLTMVAFVSMGRDASDVIDLRVMLRHMRRERFELRDMRRELASEDLTGALSAPSDGESVRGALSEARASAGALTARDPEPPDR